MTVTLLSHPVEGSRPILVAAGALPDALPQTARRFAEATGFTGKAGEVAILPGPDGAPAAALVGIGTNGEGAAQALLAGHLGPVLPEGDWHFEGTDLDEGLAALALALSGYRFDRYRSRPAPARDVRIAGLSQAAATRAARAADAVFLARDLVNTPVNDMGPAELAAAAQALAGRFGAEFSCIVGDELLARNLPMIHAVGRASASAPRLVDFTWGRADAPKVTLVGKGVCFDTGGLDIKPSSSMLLMKKDMGGSANVLALAQMVMAAGLDCRLRVLVPAVENAISGDAFRPSDVLTSRTGRTVEIGNTDAEGRLVLADALALADEEAPDLLIDMATLTGAARVALGPDVPPFFTPDEALADQLAAAARAVGDPIWRLPLHKPYAAGLASKIADTNNVTSDGFAGAITAALFLESFVERAGAWAHFDIYGWRPKPGALGPVGGEAQAIRAIFEVLEARCR
ncbi:leucyl aminopeptidase family protein [Aurantimonas sp. Leaf443]|uniref:leucyl aminopeptidase family protein n=1 Tax=Aurantimonas sp. Leaf443 TaxID=1736378 RepID=UPI000700A0FE|nr:leucyl aminopeptidase family protein [Aurantimonas sp. Leaf443]KQT83064.1 cytochrome C oxidase subunit II [Aurantimonas sp. Leaf443]